MKTIGQELKKAREEKELSLKEVADKTKIQSRYLEALENGDWERLPEEVYLRGFIKTYAQHLGLDAPALVEAYNKARAREKGDGEEIEESGDNKGGGWIVTILVLLGLGVLGYLGWYFWW